MGEGENQDCRNKGALSASPIPENTAVIKVHFSANALEALAVSRGPCITYCTYYMLPSPNLLHDTCQDCPDWGTALMGFGDRRELWNTYCLGFSTWP